MSPICYWRHGFNHPNLDFLKVVIGLMLNHMTHRKRMRKRVTKCCCDLFCESVCVHVFGSVVISQSKWQVVAHKLKIKFDNIFTVNHRIYFFEILRATPPVGKKFSLVFLMQLSVMCVFVCRGVHSFYQRSPKIVSCFEKQLTCLSKS